MLDKARRRKLRRPVGRSGGPKVLMISSIFKKKSKANEGLMNSDNFDTLCYDGDGENNGAI